MSQSINDDCSYSGALKIIFNYLPFLMAPLFWALNNWEMSEQMNELIGIRCCLSEDRMIKKRRQKDNNKKINQHLFLFCFLLSLSLIPLTSNPHRCPTWKTIWVRACLLAVPEWECSTWPWYFHFNMCTCNG